MPTKPLFDPHSSAGVPALQLLARDGVKYLAEILSGWTHSGRLRQDNCIGIRIAPSAAPTAWACRRCRCAPSSPAFPACGRCAPPTRRRRRDQPRPRRIDIGDPPADAAQPVRRGGPSVLAGPVRHLDDEIAATEEHQPAPFRMRAVERHVEPEPRAIERGGTFRSAVATTTWSIAVIGAAAVGAESGRSFASSRKNSRTPRVTSVAARVRFHDKARRSPHRGFRPPQSVRASAPADRACDASGRCRRFENKCLRAPRPARQARRGPVARSRHRRWAPSAPASCCRA